MEKSQTVGVIGGMGMVGKYLAETLLESNFKVKFLTRNPPKVLLKDSRLDVFKGDARDSAAIKDIFRGCFAVINTLGIGKQEKPYYSEVTKRIIGALFELKVEKYILVSHAALLVPGDKRGLLEYLWCQGMKLIFPELMKDKQDEYKILTESRIDWTLFRLPQVKNSSIKGVIKVGDKNLPGNTIGNKDVAIFITSQLTSNLYSRKTPFISN